MGLRSAFQHFMQRLHFNGKISANSWYNQNYGCHHIRYLTADPAKMVHPIKYLQFNWILHDWLFLVVSRSEGLCNHLFTSSIFYRRTVCSLYLVVFHFPLRFSGPATKRGGGVKVSKPPEPLSKKHFFHQRKKMNEKIRTTKVLEGGVSRPEWLYRKKNVCLFP